jgi:DNA-binding LytR/AlgR family response regulator
MTPATALIAEDEPLLAAALQADLAGLWPALQVVAVAGDGLRAMEQALALKPQLCFLDIRMPGLSGLEVARALAEDWPGGAAAPAFPLLVFVTAYDQYAIEAFDAQAVDYLLKPVQPDRLAACVQRLQRTLAARGDAAATINTALQQLRGLLGSPAATPPRLQVIQAQAGSSVHLVPVEQVIYFEAADKYVRVLTAQHEHLIRMSLRELLPQLDPAQFWQVHRATVVQARCIESARRDDSGKVFLKLRGRPETIIASRLYAHLFKGM